MLKDSLGFAIKKKGLTQTKVWETLTKKYGLEIGHSTFTGSYCRSSRCGKSDNWNLIRAAVAKEYGIVYETRWVNKIESEVIRNG